jgi:hypothetical protein
VRDWYSASWPALPAMGPLRLKDRGVVTDRPARRSAPCLVHGAQRVCCRLSASRLVSNTLVLPGSSLCGSLGVGGV